MSDDDAPVKKTEEQFPSWFETIEAIADALFQLYDFHPIKDIRKTQPVFTPKKKA